MGEQMDGWPLSWRREGHAEWREVVLEMEEKKRGDINLAEGRPGQHLSLSVSLSLKTHTHIHTDARAHHPFPAFLSASPGAAAPRQVKNSRE